MSHQFPPTPAPSTDIEGKKSSAHLDTFSLPPSALGSDKSSASLSSNASTRSDSSFHPTDPVSPASPQALIAGAKVPATRRRLSAVKDTNPKDGYSLPPPPSRSRTIIQMKPREKNGDDMASSKTPATSSTKAAGTKRKQATGNTAAGRKIARKTAHSLIERRRRSKMNEEFNVLKDMIPACRNQDMHKLAILQASIEYMRYLEECVRDLNTAHDESSRGNSHSRAYQTTAPPSTQSQYQNYDEADSDSDSDEEMSEAPTPAGPTPNPQYPSHNRSSHHPSISPAIMPSAKTSVTSTPYMAPSTTTSPNILPSPHLERTHSYTTVYSALPSPSFSSTNANSQQQQEERLRRQSQSAYSTFSLTSPALGPLDANAGARPNKEDETTEDHEATAALLMLNTDRRSWSSTSGGAGARGMSVRDLLSH
ncbi:hypothetical protein K402DRAFT_411037 [Aulographum hederae CBS 113979]|uniref:BHLH domain-containing protein n=1 Tax=Aulographum hederae CBS 113979 TaxID=1176131 RepID=A0A6G1H8B0_9PEZI|nr:hypothetical protein K402DRAFT_411037 [Aulographum hederae CBS 113979]